MKNTEYDSSLEMLIYLKEKYKGNLADCIVKVDEDKGYFEAIFKNGIKKSKSLNLRGDICFNFSKKQIRGLGRSRVAHLQKLIGDDENYGNKLQKCCEKHHSVLNVSLMPRTGNLQSVKQGLGNDRFDTFIWALNQYYNGNNLLFNFCSFENASYLKSYLDCFENVYDYCNVIYNIRDEKYVDTCIEYGIQGIDSKESAQQFIDLSCEFFDIQTSNKLFQKVGEYASE